MDPAFCGDGEKDGDEGCDDDNLLSGDGCSTTCSVEAGFTCDSTKWPSLCSASCGNGLVEAPEECDDEDGDEFDDCTTGCRVHEAPVEVIEEPLFSAPEPRCGDGFIEANEACDDGDAINGDGCSVDCTVESGWYCSGLPSVCTTICGDGILAGDEQCDHSLGPGGSSQTCTSECVIILI